MDLRAQGRQVDLAPDQDLDAARDLVDLVLADGAPPTQPGPQHDRRDSELIGVMQAVHPNEPTVYAMERYVLVGAVPGNYTVTVHLFADTSCTTGIAALPSITFATNAVGNGVGHLRLPPSAIPAGFHSATIGIIWGLAGDTGASYDTACSTVVLD